MNRRVVIILSLFVLLIGFLAAGFPFSRPAFASWVTSEFFQRGDREFFEATGFTVSGAFLTYFREHGGLDILGYPISAAYVDQSGILVQYFQKARLEWHPENPDPYKVLLGLLAEQLGYRQSPVSSPSLTSPRKRYFPETGHFVAYKFLDFFREHGGIDVFGYPITEMFVEDQSVVQYFQRMKLVWDVEASRVTVANLGELYASVYAPPVEFVRPEPSFQISAEEVELELIIDLSHWVANPHQDQEVMAVVMDKRTRELVRGARVSVAFVTDTGEVEPGSVCVRATDERGRAKAIIPLTGLEPGTWTTVRVEAELGSARVEARELFLVWW
ncbi:MAG: LGFP repeat-containing protein [Anaerolineae bacterium]